MPNFVLFLICEDKPSHALFVFCYSCIGPETCQTFVSREAEARASAEAARESAVATALAHAEATK